MPPVQSRDLPDNGSNPSPSRASPKLPDSLKASTCSGKLDSPSPVAAVLSPWQQEALTLLTAVWGECTGQHFLASRDPATGHFQSQPVANAEVAAEKAMLMDAQGLDVYFAPASFHSTAHRKEANVARVQAFWLDIDCGEEKSEKGQGYASRDIARQVLIEFCSEVALPQPTHCVNSGNGLHVYWPLEQSIGPKLWKDAADKLKALLKVKGILADPSRTADLASLMRVPGTHNRKSEPALPVTRVAGDHASDQVSLALATFLDSLSITYNKCVAVAMPAKTAIAAVITRPLPTGELDRLAAALKVLDPDCDDQTWKFGRLGPLAELARQHPEQADALHELARSWSSGQLRGKPCKAWSTPGGNGQTGEEVFESVWERLLNSTYAGKRPGLGTIYHDAKAAGWSVHEFTPTETEVIQPSGASGAGVNYLRSAQQRYSLANIDGKLWLLDEAQLKQSSAEGLAAKLVLSNRSDGLLLIKRYLSRLGANEEQVARLSSDFLTSPVTVCYSGIEFNPHSTNENSLNLWVGPTLIPQAGGWTLIRSFLLDVICDGDQTAFDYLIRYLAHSLRCPEDKPGVFIILIGGQGVGKGTLARILRKIWSATFLLLHRIEDVTGSFNAALERAFIVFLDEALFVGDRKASDALKSLITEPIIQINEKYQPARQTRSFHRFFAATNAEHFKNTERDDRRDFVLRVSEAHKGDHAYWSALNAEIEQGGVAAMMDELLKMNLSGFNVRDKPSTQALMAQKLHSLTPIERWWYETLMAGAVDSESWPKFIATHTAIEQVMEVAGGRMYRKPTSIDVVRTIKKLCPSASNAQRTESMVRQRGLDLPPLAQARAEFEAYLGGSVPWEY